MAQAKECDRCGVLYKPYNTNTGEFNAVERLRVSSNGDILYRSTVEELCPDCYKKYCDFIFSRDELKNNEISPEMRNKLMDLFDLWNLGQYIPHHTERAMLADFLLANDVIVLPCEVRDTEV